MGKEENSSYVDGIWAGDILKGDSTLTIRFKESGAFRAFVKYTESQGGKKWHKKVSPLRGTYRMEIKG